MAFLLEIDFIWSTLCGIFRDRAAEGWQIPKTVRATVGGPAPRSLILLMHNLNIIWSGMANWELVLDMYRERPIVTLCDTFLQPAAAPSNTLNDLFSYFLAMYPQAN